MNLNKPGHNPALPNIATDCAQCDHLNHAKPGDHCSEYRVFPDFKCEKNTHVLHLQRELVGIRDARGDS